jgi:hypothetical protein
LNLGAIWDWIGGVSDMLSVSEKPSPHPGFFDCFGESSSMSVIRFLFAKIRQYDPKMLWMLVLNAITSAL